MERNCAAIFAKFEKEYSENENRYRQCCAGVAEDLALVLSEHTIHHMPISYRVKGLDSIKAALKRREGERIRAGAVKQLFAGKEKQLGSWENHCRKYNWDETAVGPFPADCTAHEALPDLLGLRIALYYPDDLDKVIEALSCAGYKGTGKPKPMGGLNDVKRLRKLEETWLEKGPEKALNAHNSALAAYEKQFSGYSAIHWVVQVQRRVDKHDQWKDLRVEIQIDTVVMHAWAEVEHDITYKTHRGEVTEDEQRVLDIVNGLSIAATVALRGLNSPAQLTTKLPGEKRAASASKEANKPAKIHEPRFETPKELERKISAFVAARDRAVPDFWIGLEPLFLVLRECNDTTVKNLRHIMNVGNDLAKKASWQLVHLDEIFPVLMLEVYTRGLPEVEPPSVNSYRKAQHLAAQVASAFHLAAIFGCTSALRHYFMRPQPGHPRQQPVYRVRGNQWKLSILDFLDCLHPEQSWRLDDLDEKISDLEFLLEELILWQVPGDVPLDVSGQQHPSVSHIPEHVRAIQSVDKSAVPQIAGDMLLAQIALRLAKRGFTAIPTLNNKNTPPAAIAVPCNMMLDSRLSGFFGKPHCNVEDRLAKDVLIDLKGPPERLKDMTRKWNKDARVYVDADTQLRCNNHCYQSLPAKEGCLDESRLVLLPLSQTGDKPKDQWQLLCGWCQDVQWNITHNAEITFNDAQDNQENIDYPGKKWHRKLGPPQNPGIERPGNRKSDNNHKSDQTNWTKSVPGVHYSRSGKARHFVDEGSYPGKLYSRKYDSPPHRVSGIDTLERDAMHRWIVRAQDNAQVDHAGTRELEIGSWQPCIGLRCRL